MFQKESFTIPSDSSGIYIAKVIQVRRCRQRVHAIENCFVRVVLKYTKVALLKQRKRLKRGFVIRSKKYTRKQDGVVFSFQDNALVILKKRMNTLGKEIYGPGKKKCRPLKFRVNLRAHF